MNLNLLFVFLSAALIILADALIKRASVQGNFASAFFDPWMIAVYVLYFVQILLAVLVFINKGELAIYANLYVVFYCLFGLIVGVLLFKENLSGFQMAGVVLAIVAAVLLNWK